MKKNLFCSRFLIIVLLVAGCKGPSTKKDTIQKKTQLEEFQDRATGIMPNIADLTDIAFLFEISAANYIPILIHDPLKWEIYADNPLLAAANYGIYAADAIYQFAFDQKEGAYMSWMAAKSLAEELGFADIFDRVIIERMEGNPVQKDSIFNQIDEAITHMGVIYTQNEKLRVYTSLLAGNYIEKVHLVMGTLMDTGLEMEEETRLLMNRELLLVLIGQLESLEQLIGLIEEYETLEDKGFLSLELKKMRDIFLSFDLSADNLANLTYDQIYNNQRVNELYKHLLNTRNYLIQGAPAT